VVSTVSAMARSSICGGAGTTLFSLRQLDRPNPSIEDNTMLSSEFLVLVSVFPRHTKFGGEGGCQDTKKPGGFKRARKLICGRCVIYV